MHTPKDAQPSSMSQIGSPTIFGTMLSPVYKYYKPFRSVFNKDSDPPPYTCETPQIEAEKDKRQKKKRPITATDVPQWKWTEEECQEWYRCVFVKYLGCVDAVAETVAKRIQGWGPSIFSRHKNDWTMMLGYGRGSAMYNHIYKARRKRGAIPWNISTKKRMLANIHRLFLNWELTLRLVQRKQTWSS